MEHIAGITGSRDRCKADYKGVKSIKITMYFSSRCCAPGNVAGNETGRQAGREGKMRKSSATRGKGTERPLQKGCGKRDKKRRRGRSREERISAPPAETRDERRSALEDTDTFAGENAEK